MKFLLKVILFPFKLAVYGLFFLVVGYFALQINIPDVEFLKTHTPSRSSYMNLDDKADGDEIQFVRLNQMNSSIVRAVLVAEDDLFFVHEGFNWDAIKKAISRNFESGEFERGGSTISQQLARNLFLSPSKSVVRKLREMILTFHLESELSKERILELYLNFAEFGPSIYGVADASRYHFNKKPSQLSAAESALLAGFLTQPKYLGKKPYPSRSYSNQKRILYRMSRYDLNLPKSIPSQGVANQSLKSNTKYKALKSAVKPQQKPGSKTVTVMPKPQPLQQQKQPQQIRSVVQSQSEYDDYTEFLDE